MSECIFAIIIINLTTSYPKTVLFHVVYKLVVWWNIKICLACCKKVYASRPKFLDVIKTNLHPFYHSLI